MWRDPFARAIATKTKILKLFSIFSTSLQPPAAVASASYLTFRLHLGTSQRLDSFAEKKCKRGQESCNPSLALVPPSLSSLSLSDLESSRPD